MQTEHQTIIAGNFSIYHTVSLEMILMYLIAEYCRGPFYMGWHLYLRDYRVFRRNKDGGWGWIRMRSWSWMQPPVLRFLASIGIEIHGDGTCDDDGIAEFARRYPIKGRKCGKKLRGCLEVEIDEFDEIHLANKADSADT